jgi:2,4-dienoyl-CoA reductase-like NADH-dependent reductase (Old Yellow Enzyme family)
MKQVFESTELAGVTIPNRVFRSATFEGMADEKGVPGEDLITFYSRMAKGGAGAIITGITCVQPDGKAFPTQMMIDRDEVINDFRRLTGAVHEHGTPLFLQIAHAGRQTDAFTTGTRPVAPSAIRDKTFPLDKPRALSESEILELIEHFVDAAERAQKAGFDGVQLHGAHGYLLCQFLTPAMNQRTDQWGGSTENRTRIVTEIVAGIRKRLGNFPVLIKINAYDHMKNGTRLEEAVKVARILEAAGIDAVEVSCGVMEDGLNTIRVTKAPVDGLLNRARQFKNLPGFVKILMKPVAGLMMKTPQPTGNYNLDAAAAIKKQVGVPVIVVGGIRTLSDMEHVIQTETADYIALARPFIIQPDIVNRLKTGKAVESACISCGGCFTSILDGRVRCLRDAGRS